MARAEVTKGQVQQRETGPPKKKVKFSKDAIQQREAPAVGSQQKQPLSEEMIVDSDDDEVEQTTHNQSPGSTATEIKGVPINGSTQSEQNNSSDDERDDGPEINAHNSGQTNEQVGGFPDSDSQAAASQLQPDFSSLGDDRPVFGFIPPDKFNLISTDYAPIGAKFDSQHLQGKQLVFLTAPEDVTIKKIKDIAWDRIQSGAQSFEQKDVIYSVGLDTITSTRGMRVLLPTKAGYKSVHAKINHILQIHQIPSLERSAESQLDAEAANQSRTIPKREQPILKQRFRPIGAPVLHRPPPAQVHGRSASRDALSDVITGKEKPMKKKDKHKDKDNDKDKDKFSQKSFNMPEQSNGIPARKPNAVVHSQPGQRPVEKPVENNKKQKKEKRESRKEH